MTTDYTGDWANATLLPQKLSFTSLHTTGLDESTGLAGVRQASVRS